MAFRNRWRIKGILTTSTSLHVGNGGITTRSDLVDERTKECVEIAAVAMDHQEHAYLPGTTLKGCVRSWLSQHNIPLSKIDAVFGHVDPSDKNAVGGKAEFADALVVGTSEVSPQVTYWNASRLTGVAASVAIDRRTRTASPNKLFHTEFVPPGIKFELTVTGQDFEPEELDLLLFALEGFNHAENPVSIGADTSDGWGHCTWALVDVARLRKDEVTAWLQSQSLAVGYSGLISLGGADREAMKMHALSAFPASSPVSLTVVMEIHFNGPFLVNDPSRTKKDKQALPTSDDPPDHMPLRDYQGCLVLPARSLRGAIRSQAEKIARTLKPESACLAADSEDSWGLIYKDSQRVNHLCLTCQVFGAPGWRAPIHFSDFLLAKGSVEAPFSQDFLAIDRFTGGGARHLKFDAVAAYRPTLAGEITVDLRRTDAWGLGLLALTLRDLMEGDIPLGFGAAKGYGACRATITSLHLARFDLLPTKLQKVLENNRATKTDFNSMDTTSGVPVEEGQLIIIELLKADIEQVLSEKKPFILPWRLGSIHVLQGRVQQWKKFRWNASTI